MICYCCFTVSRPNSAPLPDVSFQHPSDLDLELSVSLKVKSDGPIGLPIHNIFFIN